jgi:hypothetical protein
MFEKKFLQRERFWRPTDARVILAVPADRRGTSPDRREMGQPAAAARIWHAFRALGKRFMR